MKKSQALAALALAFALGLGVIAPAASTYATVIYPNGTTQTQKDDLQADIKAANKAYGQLEKADQYIKLYTDIEWLIEQVDNANETLTDSYNDSALQGTSVTRSSVNATSVIFNDNLMETSDQTDYNSLYRYKVVNNKRVYDYIKTGVLLSQAQLRDLPELKEVSDAKDALNNLTNLIDTAEDNLDILNKNYVTNANAVTNAKASLNSIISAAKNWLGTVYQATYEGINGSIMATNYAADDLKPVDEAAYDNLVKGNAWKDATKDVYSTEAVRLGLVIDAAKNTPKYSTVKALKDAKENFDRINSNKAVDYDKALEYIAAFNTAINNYKNGTATNPSTPVQNITLKTEDGTISVTGNFAGTSVAAVKAVKSDKKVSAFGDRKYGMWDIELVDKDGNEVTFQGSVVVRVKVPEGINGAKSNIYYVNDKGQVEKIDSRIEGDYMVFTAAHFSLYAIVEDNGQVITAPKTGILAGVDGDASTTVAMVAGVATALTAAGAGVVAYRNARRSTRK